MQKAKVKSKSSKKIRPAATPEGRENQLVAMAMNLAEQQLEDGTASSQVITHFLKLGTEKAKLERAKLEHENKLLEAKTESIQSAKRSEELFERALKAMSDYRGSYMGDDNNEEERY